MTTEGVAMTPAQTTSRMGVTTTTFTSQGNAYIKVSVTIRVGPDICLWSDAGYPAGYYRILPDARDPTELIRFLLP